MKTPYWPAYTQSNFIKYDLSNINALLSALGNPHYRLPPVIHIAGTNGKGSSCAMLKSIFLHAGYKVHCYTSPHLKDFNERIVLDNKLVSDEYLIDLCSRTKDASDKAGITPSFFEGTTAAAFLGFAEVPADILILETGMGGRLDATNVVQKPIATLITTISYDHINYLGSSLKEIATEKAGIMKANTNCIISAQEPEALNSLLHKADEVNAKPIVYGRDFSFTKILNGFSYRSSEVNYTFPFPALAGEHQLFNASAVIATIEAVKKEFNISEKSISQGLRNTSWPGRLDKIDLTKIKRYKHLTSMNLWVDGAHNISGAKALAEWIKTDLINSNEPTCIIFGMTKKRNFLEFCEILSPVVDFIYTVPIKSEPGSFSPEFIQSQLETNGIASSLSTSIEDVLDDIYKITPHANVIVCGSLFLAADFYDLVYSLNANLR